MENKEDEKRWVLMSLKSTSKLMGHITTSGCIGYLSESERQNIIELFKEEIADRPSSSLCEIIDELGKNVPTQTLDEVRKEVIEFIRKNKNPSYNGKKTIEEFDAYLRDIYR